jgi:hypothetical integral membrane protein (TIGR02206 family)
MAAGRFTTFGAEHFLLLGLFVAGAVGVVLLGRTQRGTPRARRFSRVFAVTIPCVTVPSQVVQLTPDRFSLGSSLPLQLCDLAWMAAVWALWTHGRVPVALTYYWGFTLSVQGILTPSLVETFPQPGYLAFWAMHFLIVWAAVYLALGLGLGPGWREYRVTVAVTVVWAVLVFAFNSALDVNYGYVNRKPGSASLLDLLGPWPVYVFAALAILLAGWALITWPWVLVGRRRDRRTAGGG